MFFGKWLVIFYIFISSTVLTTLVGNSRFAEEGDGYCANLLKFGAGLKLQISEFKAACPSFFIQTFCVRCFTSGVVTIFTTFHFFLFRSGKKENFRAEKKPFVSGIV